MILINTLLWHLSKIHETFRYILILKFLIKVYLIAHCSTSSSKIPISRVITAPRSICPFTRFLFPKKNRVKCERTVILDHFQILRKCYLTFNWQDKLFHTKKKSFVYRLVASDCVPRWRAEAEYLRFIHGFLQSAPQLLLQSVILLKGIHIHSLHEVVEAIQLAIEDQNSIIDSITLLISTKPLRWYWGLIQVKKIFSLYLTISEFVLNENV